MVVALGCSALLQGLPDAGEAPYRQVQVSEEGSITGVVTLAGPIPTPYIIWVKKDAAVFGETIPDERLLVSPGGHIQNVVLTLGGMTAGKPWPARRFILENRGGRFVPRVQIVRRGGELEIVNSDPVLHTVHPLLQDQTLFNLALPKSRSVKQVLTRPGLVEVLCDTHDWMKEWILVQDHPYFAITDATGTYTITGIPAGTYTLTAWHETLGTEHRPVTVLPGAALTADFVFSR